MSKVKVNWRNEYKLDNIFNIFTGIMAIVILAIDVDYRLVIIPIIVSLFINLSANDFFRGKKFY